MGTDKGIRDRTRTAADNTGWCGTENVSASQFCVLKYLCSSVLSVVQLPEFDSALSFSTHRRIAPQPLHHRTKLPQFGQSFLHRRIVVVPGYIEEEIIIPRALLARTRLDLR